MAFMTPSGEHLDEERGMGRVDSVPSNTRKVTLDASDPFEAALIDMVITNRAKRADYALDGDPFSNFHISSSMMAMDGFGPLESALFNIMQKMARLTSLRRNGRMQDTQNESVGDTYKDIAVYAALMYAMHLHFK